jgi:flavin-binding protein dodecin
MSGHTYKTTEFVGSSEKGMQDAIENAIAHASEPGVKVNWFEVTEIRGHVENGSIQHWQVAVKIGSRVDS